MSRLAALAALTLVFAVAPASAQANADEEVSAAAPAVDGALVGDWTLVRVNNVGAMERFGAEVENMWASFEADGSGEVRVEVMQDQERHERARTFQFSTRGGQIVSDSGPPVTYEILGGDLLVLRDSAGLVVELRKVAE